jgi:thiol-disulfide isomerase/thioredoxin
MTVNRKPTVVTPERFAKGMTFDQYVAYIGTPENLRREAGPAGPGRRDFSAFMRKAYETTRLDEAQVEAIRWLATQPGGPAKILVISEDWSSDCRRDVPTLARFAEAGNMELRIFTRDGQKFSASHSPSLAEAPDSNADLMAEFLNEKNGQTWQSIPVAVFYTKGLEYLYHYTEFPAVYEKDRIVYGHIRAPRPGETPEQTKARVEREFPALQASPFFRVWANAAVDEIISALHRRLLLGKV